MMAMMPEPRLPAYSRFAEVTQSGATARHEQDTKIVAGSGEEAP
jgi:hypothetical protein